MGKPRASLPIQLAIAGGIGFAGTLGLAATDAPIPDIPSFIYRLATCNIKGNISHNTGARIYRLPGQRYYHSTRINPMYGERWFCSEEEARVAGWRKSSV
jgi:hypothetical protein